MKKKFYDLNKYKSEISLPDFLKDVLGWTITEGSTYTQPKLRSPSGDLQLIIKLNHKGHYTCWNTYETDPFQTANKVVEGGDKKILAGSTIIDIMQYELQKRTGRLSSISEVAEYLEKYIANNKTVSKKNSSFQLEMELITNEKEYTRIRVDSVPLNDTKYLQNRGINPEVLKMKEWDDVFRNTKFYNTSTKQTFVNTATRLVNKSGVVGMSIRLNDGQKRIEGHRLDAISSSRFNAQIPIDKLHIFESMIDAVSYYQMFYYPQKDEKNIRMVSTEGAMTAAQVNTIQEVIYRNKVKEVELNFDNDIHGLIYAANFIGNISIDTDKQDQLEYMRVAKSGKEEDQVLCVDFKLKPTNTLEVTDIMTKYGCDRILDTYLEKDQWQTTILNPEKDNLVFRISMPAHKEVLKELAENISEVRFGKLIVLNLPNDKDFNIDLNLLRTDNKNIHNNLSI